MSKTLDVTGYRKTDLILICCETKVYAASVHTAVSEGIVYCYNGIFPCGMHEISVFHIPPYNMQMVIICQYRSKIAGHYIISDYFIAKIWNLKILSVKFFVPVGVKLSKVDRYQPLRYDTTLIEWWLKTINTYRNLSSFPHHNILCEPVRLHDRLQASRLKNEHHILPEGWYPSKIRKIYLDIHETNT